MRRKWHVQESSVSDCAGDVRVGSGRPEDCQNGGQEEIGRVREPGRGTGRVGFWWNGRIETGTERLLIMKTNAKRAKRVGGRSAEVAFL